MAVYLVAPAGVYTGGPTALFQLCNALRRYGVNAIIAFYGKIEGDPLHPNYRKYECPWVTVNDIKNEKTNAIITPETAINQTSRFSNIKKIIYWLAVDNYVLSSYKRSKLNYISYLVKDIP
jgi:spore coat polysaccharide biosynthesis predicted glycosyltransferase SpsG